MEVEVFPLFQPPFLPFLLSRYHGVIFCGPMKLGGGVEKSDRRLQSPFADPC